MALSAVQVVAAEPGAFGLKLIEAPLVICAEVKVTALVQALCGAAKIDICD